MSFEDDLSAVEERVAEARRLMQRQKGLVVRLGTAGASTLDAQRILWLLESNLRRLENHRDFLKANFGSALMTSGRSRPVFHRTTCFPPVIGQTVTPALILHEAPFAHFHCVRPRISYMDGTAKTPLWQMGRDGVEFLTAA
jgi:hypothetical protein